MLIADIGGTRARFALSPAPGIVGAVLERATGDGSFADVLRDVLASLGLDHCPSAAFAVAGPVTDARADLTNAGWHLDARAIEAAFGIEQVALVNDFAAIAHALPLFDDGDLEAIAPGVPDEDAPKAVLGPGTGLGVAAAVPTAGGAWTVLAGEGGHVTLPARGAREAAIVAAFGHNYSHVSAERVLSGAGIEDLHAALHGDAGATAAEIVAQAGAGNAAALDTVGIFLDFLATVAADVALTYGAKGGVYLAGGVIAGLGAGADWRRFVARFTDKGRFSDYLRGVPVYRIAHPYPGLLGLSTLL